MYKIQSIFSSAFIALLLVCVASISSASYAGEGKYLNKEEALAHASNKTEEWTKGAGFYSPDGKLMAVWDGKKLSGTWRIKDNGEMCVTVEGWGDEGCHKYRVKEDAVELVYQGEGKVRKMEEGNTLESYL